MRTILPESTFFLLAGMAILCFMLIQPFGEPPDEANRFKVVRFVYEQGVLPAGDDPAVLIAGYGASYVYQPILPYIIQGFFLRFVGLFSQDSFLLLFAARFVNMVSGIIMAVFVRKIAKLLFSSPLSGWIFSLLIVFLPQNLFIHSYVNTDSMAALAGSIIIFAMLQGYRNHFNVKTAITLSVGIIFCALSYYNAYGIILCSILFFPVCFLKEQGKIDWRTLLRRGILISIIVLLGI